MSDLDDATYWMRRATEADEKVKELTERECGRCRFWMLESDNVILNPHKCRVAGSFSCRGGELWTDPDFGCVHFSERS